MAYLQIACICVCIAFANDLCDTYCVSGDNSLDNLRRSLRDAGLRVTQSRIAVLRALQAARQPMSHSDLIDALHSESWDQATLYRNLNDLVNAGLLQPAASGGRVQGYEMAGSSSPARHGHAHFVCNDCGAAECIDELKLPPPRHSAHFRRALKAGTFDIQVRGICDSCT